MSPEIQQSNIYKINQDKDYCLIISYDNVNELPDIYSMIEMVKKPEWGDLIHCYARSKLDNMPIDINSLFINESGEVRYALFNTPYWIDYFKKPVIYRLRYPKWYKPIEYGSLNDAIQRSKPLYCKYIERELYYFDVKNWAEEETELEQKRETQKPMQYGI